MKEKIFDIHTHVYPPALAHKASESLGHFYGFVPHGEGTVAQLISDENRYTRDGFLILAVATNPGQVDRVNEYAATAVAEANAAGKTAFFFGSIHQNTENMEDSLEQSKQRGAKGIKIHPDIQGVAIDDRRLYPVYEWLSQNRLPLCLHMGDNRPEYPFSQPQRLKKICGDFPNLTVLASHLGGYRAQIEVRDYLISERNIWYDTSSSLWYLAPQAVMTFLSRVDTDRVMFGSDYPVNLIDREMMLFDRLPLSSVLREKILYLNAKTFLNFA